MESHRNQHDSQNQGALVIPALKRFAGLRTVVAFATIDLIYEIQMVKVLPAALPSSCRP